MAAVPTLPFVVLRAHRPCSVNDIINAQATEPQNASLPGGSSPSSLNHRAPPGSSSLDESRPLATTPAGTGTSTSLITPDILRPRSESMGGGAMNIIPGSTAAMATTLPIATLLSSATHSWTIQPQVHYIFENDPLEMDILGSIPRSRCITLDLDPRSGSIKNVESFLPNLQVMDVKLVTSHAAASTSSSSMASLNTPIVNPVTQQTIDGQNAIHTGSGSSHPMTLGRTGSSEALQSSFTISTGTSRMVRGSSGRSLLDHATDTDSQTIKGMGKDWGLVIEAVQVEENGVER